MIDGRQKTLLVHRKGSTRAFPPHHPLIPVDYQLTGQPVLIGGTMGTCRSVSTPSLTCTQTYRLDSYSCCFSSYVLTGTQKGFQETFGSTCHGAVRIAFYMYLVKPSSSQKSCSCDVYLGVIEKPMMCSKGKQPGEKGGYTSLTTWGKGGLHLFRQTCICPSAGSCPLKSQVTAYPRL